MQDDVQPATVLGFLHNINESSRLTEPLAVTTHVTIPSVLLTGS